MASCSSLLEQFQCSICLDVFTDPVSTPCGHSFCKACINGQWDSSDLCQCPICKEEFPRRPELCINTLISKMADLFKKSVEVKASSTPEQIPAKPGEVPCDICTGRKLKALKSCLVCLASYCETHLEPHQRVSAFKTHKLIDPVENQEERMCKKHERPLQLFCRDDQTFVCQFCTETDHKTHSTVPIEEECSEKRTLGKTQARVQQMIQERLNKVKEIKHSVELSKNSSEKDIEACVGVFTAVVRSIERIVEISQAELLEVMEEKQKATERRAEGLIKELEQEITGLKRRNAELEQLSHTEDHLHLLQTYPSLCSPPHTNHWANTSIDTYLCVVDTLRRAVTKIEESVIKELEIPPETKLKQAQQCAVDVTLDPDTANPKLILSEDGKQVRYGGTRQNLTHNPKIFKSPCVLGKEGFSSGRFYFEVQVRGNSGWDLGVARESTNRRVYLTECPKTGHWTVGLTNGCKYQANDDPCVPLSLREKPQRVGVFVDYEQGLVSFYDVDARSRMYSFTGYNFTEKLYPYFYIWPTNAGDNSVPLIISPVNQTE